jgi:hypothetical protein
MSRAFLIERKSRDVVEQLRAVGKDVAYLMFENEGHDVLKDKNRVVCYNAIAEFLGSTGSLGAARVHMLQIAHEHPGGDSADRVAL